MGVATPGVPGGLGCPGTSVEMPDGGATDESLASGRVGVAPAPLAVGEAGETGETVDAGVVEAPGCAGIGIGPVVEAPGCVGVGIGSRVDALSSVGRVDLLS